MNDKLISIIYNKKKIQEKKKLWESMTCEFETDFRQILS
jgi:hypothetical protein